MLSPRGVELALVFPGLLLSLALLLLLVLLLLALHEPNLLLIPLLLESGFLMLLLHRNALSVPSRTTHWVAGFSLLCASIHIFGELCGNIPGDAASIHATGTLLI
ncbi:hypothetical protein DOTSEDRAFT_69918 [Dothistroma septosporum NZE10]|uniref:Uncharacterized protein n=1 Tax=Dothistroma septosporum (strain NZE10 / CBS 128990) TaxID=675120 RepID=N1PYU0_DOTSN|nr:hypothetical protein DOTSEDRAFT_69918 [Dothistroma septosporum NZE10]